MQLTTAVKIQKSENQIDYHSKIMAFGSCFSENMGEKFDYYKFQNTINPFGIIFNTASIEKLINRIVTLEYFSEKDIFQHNNMWHCFEVHSRLSHPNKDLFLKTLNEILNKSNKKLCEATHFIFTPGTSWVYEDLTTSKIVANCHKMPQKSFIKKLLTVHETSKSIVNIIKKIQTINPNAVFITTISPVRHIKDGFFENNVSKSILFQAIFAVLQTENLSYFPSYEIVMDELRDYRYFKSDMIHPSKLAIDFVWQKFKETQVSESSFLAMSNVDSIQKMMLHKTNDLQVVENQLLKNKIVEKIKKLQAAFPEIKF
jgi:hypothetical protein